MHPPAFKVFLAAGSDAHGDFNYEATLDVVDFLGKPSRGLSGYAEDNALGKISTIVYAPEGMGPKGENILRALKSGRSVLSNGPLLIAGPEQIPKAVWAILGMWASVIPSQLPSAGFHPCSLRGSVARNLDPSNPFD